MSVNSVSRLHSYRVQPISRSDGSFNEEDQNPRHSPKREIKHTARLKPIPKGEGRPQPSTVGTLLNRWV